MADHPKTDEAIAMDSRLSIQKEADPEMTQEKSTGEAFDVELDPVMERALLMKLDFAFVPIIMLTYLSCFLDRANIGTNSRGAHRVLT